MGNLCAAGFMVVRGYDCSVRGMEEGWWHGGGCRWGSSSTSTTMAMAMAATNSTSSRTTSGVGTAKVLLVDGRVLQFKVPIKAAEVVVLAMQQLVGDPAGRRAPARRRGGDGAHNTTNHNNFIVCPLKPGLHSLSILPPDHPLKLGHLYLLLPSKLSSARPPAPLPPQTITTTSLSTSAASTPNHRRSKSAVDMTMVPSADHRDHTPHQLDGHQINGSSITRTRSDPEVMSVAAATTRFDSEMPITFDDGFTLLVGSGDRTTNTSAAAAAPTPTPNFPAVEIGVDSSCCSLTQMLSQVDALVSPESTSATRRLLRSDRRMRSESDDNVHLLHRRAMNDHTIATLSADFVKKQQATVSAIAIAADPDAGSTQKTLKKCMTPRSAVAGGPPVRYRSSSRNSNTRMRNRSSVDLDHDHIIDGTTHHHPRHRPEEEVVAHHDQNNAADQDHNSFRGQGSVSNIHDMRRCRSWAPRLQTIAENPIINS